MTAAEQLQSQFIEYITLQAYDDQYIDRQEEKEILQVGVKNGISVEDSLVLIAQVASQKGWVLERTAEERAYKFLMHAASDGKIDQKEFDDASALLDAACKGKLPQREIKQRLKQMMIDNAWKAKEGGLFGSKWYTAI